ncbi:MAG TPA: RHS repeat-associated core domain-containing protein, partial [Cellvibrio sp.]
GPRQGQVTRYRYNAQNQLVEVNVAGVVTRYTYDALGRRISKTTEPGAQQSTISTTTFYWNGDVLLSEINEGVSSTSRTYLFEPFSFKPLALVQHGQVFHYHTDHIGTPREITNARAEVVWSSTFKTYGALALAHVNEVENPLRFQGQYFDSETGLHYNRHRYYDPNCGQFTTQDPIGLLGGMNAYQYAPNPMTWVDPCGLSCKDGSQVISERSAFVRMAENSRDPDFRNLNHSINERGLLAKEREIAKAANWRKADGSTWWPPYDGAIPGTQQTITLDRGVVIDRYGRTSGTFVSPAGLPLGSRALASAPTVDPNVYDVLSPIKDVEAAKIAPWFDQPGLGTQYKLPSSVQNYLDQDILGSR